MQDILKETDFNVLKEDYSRFLIREDGTVIKAKIIVKKILLSPNLTPEGYPDQLALDTMTAVTAIVHDELKRTSADSFNTLDKGEEQKFEEQKIEIQEYMTSNDFKITVKPVVTKIFRYKKYNDYGEPIYNIIIQAITNIEKIESTS